MNSLSWCALQGRVGAFAVSVLLVVVLLAAPRVVAAQGFDAPTPGDTIHEMRLLTGGRVLGWIADRSGDTIVFRSFEGGEWRLDRRGANLRRARGEVVGGEFSREDQNQSRLFFAPTGRTLHQGQAYAGVFTILPFLGVGVTDNFTMAGGFDPFGGELASMNLWLAPKLKLVSQPDRQVSAGAFFLQLFGGNPFDFEDEYYIYDPDPQPFRLGIVYGVGTFGSLNQALHVGGGVAHAFGGDARTRAIGMVGGEARLGRRWKLITENWLLLPDYPLVSVGMRSIGDRWTWDYGLMALLAEEGAPYVPIISFSYAFGAGR
jgi:hypothetical protein